MAKSQRDKGAAGEREVVRIANDRGIAAARTAPMQAFSPGDYGDVEFGAYPKFHVEVKRDEKMSVDRMCAQAEAAAGDKKVPVVVWRRNCKPGEHPRWRVTMPYEDFLRMVRPW